MVSQQLQDWFAERQAPLFQERTQSILRKSRAGWETAVQRLGASLVPSLSSEDASRLFLAIEALAGCSGAADKHLQTLREVSAQPFQLAKALEPSSMRRHNFELRAKLEVMAMLPEPSIHAHVVDVAELRRTLAEVPNDNVSEFARRWLPPGRFGLSDDREALCFLYPVPRSLIRAARQAAWEAAHPAGWQPAEQEPRSVRELRADFLVLKVLQRVTALHTSVHSPDGPGLWANRRVDRGRRYIHRSLFREATRLAESTAVMQSTHTSDVLEELVKLFQKAAYPRCDQVAEASGIHADRLSPAWSCVACRKLPLSVEQGADLPMAGPLCTCVGLQWSWADLEDGSPKEARRRAWRRCLWWAFQLLNKRTVTVDVFDVADWLQEASSLERQLAS